MIAEPANELNAPVASPGIDTSYGLPVACVDPVVCIDVLWSDEPHASAINDTAPTMARTEHVRRTEREFTTMIDLSPYPLDAGMNAD
jgi:hypothetical protein